MQATEQIPFSDDGANLSGVVLDPSEAAVAGADIVVSEVGGSQQRSTKSSADGSFSFAMLPSGSYLIHVQAKDGLGSFV